MDNKMTRKELMRLMPANGADVPAAILIVKLGHPSVIPVMRDMIRWMRVAECPVADEFAEFFGRLGASAVPVIAEGLMRENCWLRYRIFTRVLPAWPSDLVRELSTTLNMIVTQPDAYDNDIRSAALLIKHHLADLRWLTGWIAFKKDRIADRSQLLQQIESEMRSFQQPKD